MREILTVQFLYKSVEAVYSAWGFATLLLYRHCGRIASPSLRGKYTLNGGFCGTSEKGKSFTNVKFLKKEKTFLSCIQMLILKIQSCKNISVFGCSTSHIRKVTDYMKFSTSGKLGLLSEHSASIHLGKDLKSSWFFTASELSQEKESKFRN